MKIMVKNAGGPVPRHSLPGGWTEFDRLTIVQQRALQDYRVAWYDPDTGELTGSLLSWDEWAAAAQLPPNSTWWLEIGQQAWESGEDPTEWRARLQALRDRAKAVPFPKAEELLAKKALLDQLGDPANPARKRLTQIAAMGTVERAYVTPGTEVETLHAYLIDRGLVEDYVRYVMNTWMTTAQPMTAPDPQDEDLFGIMRVECAHEYVDTVEFDAEAAKGLEAEEVRRRWPRATVPCRKCGEPCIRYASVEHYIAGDW